MSSAISLPLAVSTRRSVHSLISLRQTDPPVGAGMGPAPALSPPGRDASWIRQRFHLIQPASVSGCRFVARRKNGWATASVEVGIWLNARFIGAEADAMWFAPSRTNGSLSPWEPLHSLHCSGLS